MKPKVSIIIPVLNRKDLLMRCLESVWQQTYRPLEVIIVDNGSTDGSLEKAQEWGKIHGDSGFEVKVFSELKAGACAARNRGLRVAGGEFILFFDSDDTMRQGLVSRAVGKFEKNPEAEIVCWKCEIHQLDGSLRRPPFHIAEPLEEHLIHSLFRTQGYIARSYIFHRVGGWNEELYGWNDWELGVRVLTKYPKIVYLHEILVDIYNQEKSITGNGFFSKVKVWEKSLEVVRQTILTSNIHHKDRMVLIVDYRAIVLAAHYAQEGYISQAEELKQATLKNIQIRFHDCPRKIFKYKITLVAAYHFIRLGGRGTWKLLSRLL